MFAQAGRIYELGQRSFADIISDQSFFYGGASGHTAERPNV